MTVGEVADITVVFTDIESSTPLWEAETEAMNVALMRHDQLISTLVVENGGRVVKHIGDGSCSVFGSPTDAVLAAGAINRAVEAESWPTSRPIRVRVGVHRGVAFQRDGDVFGPVVNRAARIEAAAHGGQIVVSASVTESAALPPGWASVDLGQHRLRGVAEPLQLYQITPPSGRAEFPPLAIARRHGRSLPSSRDRFVGRELEVDTLLALIGTNRLVTLTGPGGVGKTRLAVEASRTLLDRSAEEVWFADLSVVGTAAGVIDAVLGELQARPEAPTEPLDAMAAVLAGSHPLLVLDNAEHVLDGVAQLVDGLLERAPGVRILVSSRRALGLGGERVVPVRPLEADGAAVDLFVDRAQMSGAAELDAVEVAELCRELDGLPLAIELAARRAAALTVTEIRAGLRNRLDLVDGSRRQLSRPGRGTSGPRSSGRTRSSTSRRRHTCSASRRRPRNRALRCRSRDHRASEGCPDELSRRAQGAGRRVDRPLWRFGARSGRRQLDHQGLPRAEGHRA